VAIKLLGRKGPRRGGNAEARSAPLRAELFVETSTILISMTRTKKPKVQIKRTKTSLGFAYRIYIDGDYVGAGLTRESAREGAKQMLVRRIKQGH
jgi:hypothetical protein